MNSKKVFEGRQLLLVVAVFGILLMHVNSAEDDNVSAPTTAVTTKDSVTEAAGGTSASDPAAQETITSGTQDATEVFAGQRTTPAETTVAGGRVSSEATASASVHSSAEAYASIQGQSQSSKATGPTTETGVTGHTVALVYRNGRVTSEETSASLGQAKETTTENVTSIRETTAVDTTTVAPSHGYTKNYETSEILPSPQVTTSLAESSTVESATASTESSPVGSAGVIPPGSTKTSSASSERVIGENQKSSKPDIWEAHRGLFLTVLILISVCVVVTVVCCLCMAWRGRGRERHPDKQPISMEEAREAPTAVSNPIPDAEMIRDEAPMQERENPAVTPNGGGQHISKADEDNGWVVPLDELSKAEKEKPEVENTRL